MALFTCKASHQNGKISNDCGAKMLHVYVMCHRALKNGLITIRKNVFLYNLGVGEMMPLPPLPIRQNGRICMI